MPLESPQVPVLVQVRDIGDPMNPREITINVAYIVSIVPVVSGGLHPPGAALVQMADKSSFVVSEEQLQLIQCESRRAQGQAGSTDR